MIYKYLKRHACHSMVLARWQHYYAAIPTNHVKGLVCLSTCQHRSCSVWDCELLAQKMAQKTKIGMNVSRGGNIYNQRMC